MDYTHQAGVLIICSTSMMNHCCKSTNFVTDAFLERVSGVSPAVFLSNVPIDPEFLQRFAMLWSFRIESAAITNCSASLTRYQTSSLEDYYDSRLQLPPLPVDYNVSPAFISLRRE